MEKNKILTRAEFEALAKQNNWEVYTQRQVYQFSQDILKSMDETERLNGAIDYASLSRVEVINNDLTKSIMFYREQQVEWDRAEDGTLMKARSGIYKDTPANRKKGIVGQRYGETKKTEKTTKEEVQEVINRGVTKEELDAAKKYKERLKKEEEEKNANPKSRRKILGGDKKLARQIQRQLDSGTTKEERDAAAVYKKKMEEQMKDPEFKRKHEEALEAAKKKMQANYNKK